MKRRELLQRSALLGLAAAVPIATRSLSKSRALETKDTAPALPLKPPAQGSIPVAFLISDGAVVIDFCGPWEVFQDVDVPGRTDDPFHLYTVAETTNPIRTSAGMKVIPDFTFANAPAPKVIVIPAQRGATQAALNWI